MYHIRKDLIIKTTLNQSGIAALLVSAVALIYLVFRWGDQWFDYITAIMGMIMTYLTVISGGITEKGLKSSSRIRRTTQLWSGVKRVEIDRGKLIKLSYVGNLEANVLYFKKDDYSELAKLLETELNENTKIIVN